MAAQFAFHEQAVAEIHAPPAQVFGFLDDHRRLSAHMESSSLMMAGSSMHIETDDHLGQAVGSRIRLRGRVLGIHLWLEEAVTEYEPPRRKVWETLGEPRLLVIGRYRMGYSVEPADAGSTVCIWIDYELPARGVGHWLGVLAGRFYARWCVRQMLHGIEDT